MFDHARGFDLLAPLLAARFRVVGVDARGHGDSGWADAYSWQTDVIDVLNVLRSLGRPAHLVGHSVGGGRATDAACYLPELVRQVANLDGFGPSPEGFRPPGFEVDTRSVPERFAAFLDRRRADEERAWRPYASLEELVARRQRINPRLAREWLRYFLFHAARPVEGGFVWKVDPSAAGGFGPFKPEWIAPFWRRLRAPLLAVIGSEPDTWGPLPEPLLRERLAFVARLERATVQGAGHFVHMERPRETADLLLAWLDR
jgi:pimeloyl-ACP methyl ester carboxylesterase